MHRFEFSQSSLSNRLGRLRAFAKLLDEAVEIPGLGIKFGLDPLISLIPWVGDAAAALLSGWIILEARRMGVPRWLLTRMFANVSIDLLIGAVPVLGDIFDVAWKANTRNLRLLEQWLAGLNLAATSIAPPRQLRSR